METNRRAREKQTEKRMVKKRFFTSWAGGECREVELYKRVKVCFKMGHGQMLLLQMAGLKKMLALLQTLTIDMTNSLCHSPLRVVYRKKGK